MKKLILCAFLLFGACAPTPLPPTPEIRESVVPTIIKVEENNEELKKTVQKQKEIIKVQQSEIDESIRLAEELKKKLAAALPDDSGSDTTELVDLLNRVKERNLFLERTTEELTEQLADAQALLAQARQLGKAKDEESLKWQTSYKALAERNAQTEKELVKQKEKAATAGVYRNWVIGLAVGFVAWLIIKNILMVYFPASSFLKRV